MAVDSSVLIEHTTLQCQGLPQDAPCPHRVIVRPIVIDLSLAHRWISRFRYLFEEILQLYPYLESEDIRGRWHTRLGAPKSAKRAYRPREDSARHGSTKIGGYSEASRPEPIGLSSGLSNSVTGLNPVSVDIFRIPSKDLL